MGTLARASMDSFVVQLSVTDHRVIKALKEKQPNKMGV